MRKHSDPSRWWRIGPSGLILQGEQPAGYIQSNLQHVTSSYTGPLKEGRSNEGRVGRGVRYRSTCFGHVAVYPETGMTLIPEHN